MNDKTREKYINKISFRYTQDGSVGLYNHEVDDIYHSSYGAKTEAVEKFIRPLNFSENFYNLNNINILDICYGIGYNTKAILNHIIKSKCNANISIDILEYDKALVLYSPFINDGFCKKDIITDYILLKELQKHIVNDFESLKNCLFTSSNHKYLSSIYRSFYENKKILLDAYTPQKCLNQFLHNIYYHCISSCNKKRLKALYSQGLLITPFFADARNTILETKKLYDIVLLDAFTPAKLPTLWSIDFFKRLNEITKQNSLIVTYSNSAAVRNAMIHSGFFVGKIYDSHGRASGTCASKNKALILNKLNDYELGLLKTSAGIYFKDESLSSTSEEILAEWRTRKLNSNLESSSHYIKKHKKRIENEI